MVVKRRILLRVKNLQQRRTRIAAPVIAQLVYLVKQKQRIGSPGLFHAFNNLAGHGTDIGPSMAANFSFVAHAAQRRADKGAAGSSGDRLAERGLADARRADQTQNRAFNLVGTSLHGQIFENSLFNLVQPVMILLQNLHRLVQVLVDL